MSQNNHLVWVWMPNSLIGQRRGGFEEVKTIILQISTEMDNLREGTWQFLPAEGQGSLRKVILYDYFGSVTQSCPKFQGQMDCNRPGFPVLHNIPGIAQIHVHWVGNGIQPSHPLSLPSPPAFNLSQHQGLYQSVCSSHRWPKYWNFSFSIISGQSLSLTLCDTIDCSQASLSSTISQSLLKLMSVESVKPSNHHILCHTLLLLPSIFPSIRSFSNESILPIRWPKYWSFSFSISPSNEWMISFRMDWFDLLAIQETLKSLLQHHSSKS